MNKIFALNLKQLLKARRITLKSLAIRIGISYQHMQNVVNGHRDMNSDILYKIMIALKLSEIDVVALTVNPTVQVNNGIKEINCHPMPRKIKSNLKDVEDGFHLYKILYETDLDSTYSSDEEFKKAAILHLYNTVYKQMFLDIENEESDLTRYIDQTNNGIFLEIVDLIKNLDTDHQLKLRDLIKLFLNSIK